MMRPSMPIASEVEGWGWMICAILPLALASIGRSQEAIGFLGGGLSSLSSFALLKRLLEGRISASAKLERIVNFLARFTLAGFFLYLSLALGGAVLWIAAGLALVVAILLVRYSVEVSGKSSPREEG